MIQASASRRELMPARATTLAMRSPALEAFGVSLAVSDDHAAGDRLTRSRNGLRSPIAITRLEIPLEPAVAAFAARLVAAELPTRRAITTRPVVTVARLEVPLEATVTAFAARTFAADVTARPVAAEFTARRAILTRTIPAAIARLEVFLETTASFKSRLKPPLAAFAARFANRCGGSRLRWRSGNADARCRGVSRGARTIARRGGRSPRGLSSRLELRSPRGLKSFFEAAGTSLAGIAVTRFEIAS